MPVLVTRPLREARSWVDRLVACGLDARALPLIDIAPVHDRQPLRDAWRRIGDYRAVMFVSGNAADRFFGENPVPGLVEYAHRATDFIAWSTGPGTRDALVHAGVPAAQIRCPAPDAPQFDSEALWAQVAHEVRPGDAVLIVRGADAQERAAGRDWLAHQLAQSGVRVDTVLAYRRSMPVWTDAEMALARDAATDGSVWLLSSSEAVGHLLQLLPEQSWLAARAVATHPRIAQAARAAGFGVVCESRPTVDALVASIESMA
jgi:uroporphyrinogen-III synthase